MALLTERERTKQTNKKERKKERKQITNFLSETDRAIGKFILKLKKGYEF